MDRNLAPIRYRQARLPQSASAILIGSLIVILILGFGGIMTVPYCALRMGRKAIGVELNPDYWRDGVTYAETAAGLNSGPSLFDLLDAEAA